MSNTFRSKAFFKIRNSIRSATDARHLISCRALIENATPIVSSEELGVLKEYLLSAWDKFNATGESFADEMDSIQHRRLSL